MLNDQVLAGIKVLVALAVADGTVHAVERLAIENALEGADLLDDTTVAKLLEDAGAIDLDAELAKIVDEEVRKRTFDAASALVFVDGEVSPEERELLDKVRVAFGLAEDGTREERFEKFTSRVPGSSVTKVTDPKERDALVDDEIARASAFSAVLSRLSLPIAAESCVFTNNVKLARNIGLAWGHDANESFWRTFVSNVAGSAAPWFAVSSLLKLVPGYSGANAYAATFAVGEATRRYFRDGEKTEPAALKETFQNAKAMGRSAAKDATAAIDALEEKISPDKKKLDDELAAKTIEETDYADKLVALSS